MRQLWTRSFGGNSRRHKIFRPGIESLETRLVPCVDDPLGHHDGAELHADEAHVDRLPPVEAGDTGGGSSPGAGAGAVTAFSVPTYSSRPGAAASLFLDFDGHFDAQWGSYSNITTPAYDTDGNPSALSSAELNNIYQIWQYVAEDYAPFNINVTTLEPGSFANGVALRVAIGGNGSWSGGTYGGISYIDSFTNSIVNTAYVFPANLGNGYPKYVGEASSHEAGHAFGLRHQSQWSGTTKLADYYGGPGDGTAPVMGNSYSATRGLWWYGTSTSSTTFQDDLAVLARGTNGFGYRADDHGNAAATATPLTVSGTGAVSGAGVIEQMTDVDTFSFSTAAGSLSLTVTVPAPYNNLDARLELRDAAGTVVAAADPDTSFSATITYAASAGTYSLTVASDGRSGGTTATNYGFNVGQYTLSGTVIATGASAPAAPTSLAASAVSGTQINLTWADNAGNEDGFKIERLDGGVWTQVATVGANVTSWQDTGRAAATTYTYRVRAYNAAGDSAYSNTAGATTPAVATAPAAPSALTGNSRTRPSARVNLSWADNATNETGFRVYRSSDGGATWAQVAQVGANATSYSDRTVSRGATYDYKVLAFNAAGDSPFSNTITVTVGGSAGPTGAAPFAPGGPGRADSFAPELVGAAWRPAGTLPGSPDRGDLRHNDDMTDENVSSASQPATSSVFAATAADLHEEVSGPRHREMTPPDGDEALLSWWDEGPGGRGF